jgi:hypothetical protein
MNNTIHLNSIVKWADDLVSCDMEGETALMSVENGKYYSLDPVGSRIWAFIEKARPVSAICSVLLEEFEVEPSQCRSDVLAFLNELAQDNLIKVVDESTA